MNAMIPAAGDDVTTVTVPRDSKPLVLECQIEASETLADASYVAFSAKAEFGSGLTSDMVSALDKARTAFARARDNSAESTAKTMRPARRKAV